MTKKTLRVMTHTHIDVTTMTHAQIEALKAFTVLAGEAQGITCEFELIEEQPAPAAKPVRDKPTTPRGKDSFVEAVLDRVAELLADAALDEADGNV